MKFFTDSRLLILSIWLGAAVFFIGVAQSSFAVLPTREMAGLVVGRTLSILNYGGLGIAGLLLLLSMIGSAGTNKFLLWTERLMLLLLAAACGVGELIIGLWLTSIRAQMGRPVDEIAVDDPLRLQFNTLHEWSVWVLFTGMLAALIAFFLIANRRSVKPKPQTSDIYDFQKEFKI